jgi:DNA polymerase sigma
MNNKNKQTEENVRTDKNNSIYDDIKKRIAALHLDIAAHQREIGIHRQEIDNRNAIVSKLSNLVTAKIGGIRELELLRKPSEPVKGKPNGDVG